MSRVQRAVVYLMIAGFTVALLIGFWPVKVNVSGDASYSCGSGFIHSQHTWIVDSRTLADQRTGGLQGATGTPKHVCPNKIFNNRDLALWIASFVLVFGFLILALTARPQDRSSQAIFASMRLRGSKR
jgi:disulfide bond formation protein DsbB